MKVAEIYTTFMGECNPKGIGAPAIFLRMSGCPIRCYAATLGTLCDTPLFLERKSGEDRPIDFLQSLEANEEWEGKESILEELNRLRMQTGITTVCLTGGDPLWQKEEQLHKLFKSLEGFYTVVETSGTLSPEPFLKYTGTSFILDYKTKSAGVRGNRHMEYMHLLRATDFIKFVLYDYEDYHEMLEVLKSHEFQTTKAQIWAGTYWGGKMETFELFEKLKTNGLLGKVNINMQAHKLVIAADFKKPIPEKI
jgi:7-carboxy-7-deazaguanine synthase